MEYLMIITSDGKPNAFDALWILRIFHCVHPLVWLSHLVYNEVAEFLVEFGPAADYGAAAYQVHLRWALGRSAFECDLKFERGQHDVEILPEEESSGFFINWIIWRTKMKEEAP